MKILVTIKYRILFPYPNVSINDLYEENQKEEYYSDEYVVSVNLESIWGAHGRQAPGVRD
jgi:hypothetical protein